MKKLSQIKISTILHTVIIATFFFILFAFLIGSILLPDREYSETENRTLASFPVISTENIFNGKFMSDFETYLSDQFINRDFVVSVKTGISSALGNKDVNGVYIGKNDRLFEVPSVPDKDDISAKAELINNFTKKFDIENKYFILAPNSTYILPEQLPYFLSCENQGEQIAAFYSELNDDFKCIDASNILSEYDNRDALYLKTDHHWTATAAKLVFDNFVCYAELDNKNINYITVPLSNSFSGTLSSSSGVDSVKDNLFAVIPENIENTFIVHNYDTQEKKATFFDTTRLESKNQYEIFFGGNFSRIRIYTKNVNSRNLLIFKDSYANCFIPLLIPHYENIIIIDPRYFTGNIEDVMADYNYTDILFLYNLNTFIEDSSLKTVLS